MYIPDKMKLNKFRQVRIPANNEYFARFGTAFGSPSVGTGDEVLFTGNKTDVLAHMDEYDKMMQREEDAKGKN